LTVIHAERGGATALVYKLHTQEPVGEARPVLQILGAQPDITQRLQAHRRISCGGTIWALIPRPNASRNVAMPNRYGCNVERQDPAGRYKASPVCGSYALMRGGFLGRLAMLRLALAV